MTTQPWQMDGSEISRLVREKKLSAREVVDSYSERIDATNAKLNAIVLRTDEYAHQQARLVDDGAITGPLAGVVATSKINTDHVPFPMDNGVRAFKDNASPSTHSCIKGLEESGAAFIGRTNAPAISMRFHTGNELHGETINPHNPLITPGGSSGGAGVAVATGMCAIGQGNDVGGSIRFPAFCNGIYGLRPTVGRMSTGGSNATLRTFMGSIMATNGPLARTMADIRLGYGAMLHPNWADPLWVPARTEFDTGSSPRRIAIVINDELGIDPYVQLILREAADTFRTAGYEVDEVNPPLLDSIFSLWTQLAVTDVMNAILPALPFLDDPGLTRAFNSWLPTFPEESTKTLMDGLHQRELVLRAWNQFFDQYPLVMMPSWNKPFMRANEDIETDDAMQHVADDGRYMLSMCALGLPALALPMGVRDGVPSGVQIAAHMWREDLLLQAGDAFEAVRGKVSVLD
jgi:amidase